MIHCQSLRTAEKKFFKSINRIADPAIRAGVGSPWLIPVGLVVMETVGRKSGRVYNIPVLAWGAGDLLVVSTVRGNSQWFKNVASRPEIHVWLRGRRRSCLAQVVSDDNKTVSTRSDQGRVVPVIADGLQMASRLGLASFAILVLEREPRTEGAVAAPA